MVANEKALSLLKRIGLNHYESQTYAALFRRNNSTAGEVAELANVPRSRVYDVLTSLEKKGFAVAQLGRPVRYNFIRPGDAIKNLKEHHQQIMDEKLVMLEEIGGLLKEEIDLSAEEPAMSSSEAVSIIRGKSNIYSHIRQLIDSSSKSVVKLTNADGLKNLNRYCGNSIKNANDRGVEVCVATSASNEAVDAGDIKKHAKIKKVRTLTGRFFVKDKEETLLVTNHGDNSEDTGLLVKSPYLASCLRELFEHAWQNGEFLAE